jgi:hypothetical protein
MKFDYIIGNPPYQSSTSRAGKGSKKIYFQITHKMMDLFKEQMIFICPKPILTKGTMNRRQKEIISMLTTVKEADKYFKESTNAIIFKLDRKNKSSKVFNKDTNRYEMWYECLFDGAKDFFPLFLKLSSKENNKPKLKIKPSHSPIGYKSSEITDTGDVKVIHQSEGNGPANRKIKYTSINKPKMEKIVVAYSSKWFTPFITDYHTSEFFGIITEKDYPKEQWNNIISYLSTDTIKDFIEGVSKMKQSNYYNGLWQLTEVDFSHPWTDEMVRKEFGLDKL